MILPCLPAIHTAHNCPELNPDNDHILIHWRKRYALDISSERRFGW
ncbi:hypothetical protein [Roseiflexus sp.]|nr:hypothetical protein [Roseiflexus sp.]